MSSEISHVGLRLLNRYHIDEPISSSALCQVYRGQDTVLRRSIAVKAIAPDHVETYRNALRATAALSHPAIVATYDALEQDGWLFVIQEYVTARALVTYLRDGVPSERAADLGGQIARAIAYAHAHDITHGDLTPAAVLVDRQATVRINNFCLPTDVTYFTERAREWDIAPETLLSPDGASAAMDVTATGLLLWLLLSELKRSTVDDSDTPGGVRRDFRPDVPEHLRELVRRCVRRADAGAIADADTLCQEFEELSVDLAKSRSRLAEQTPPALRVARAAVERDAAWSAETTLGSVRSWGLAHAGDPVSQNAPTVPQTTGTSPWLASVPTASIAPRLRLPSRQMPGGEMEAYPSAWSARPLTETEQAAQEVTEKGTPHNGQIKLWVVVAIGIALFVLFFLIGFFTTYRLGG